MFLSTQRFNPLFDIDSEFNSLWNNHFDDQFFSSSLRPNKFSVCKEDRFNNQLSLLKNYEERFLNDLKSFESEFEQLKNSKFDIESKMKDLEKQMNMIEQENLKQVEKSGSDKDGQSYVLKRCHYKTDDMEIEEQYDSRNAEKCYKIIKKEGEQPQIMYLKDKQPQIKSINHQN